MKITQQVYDILSFAYHNNGLITPEHVAMRFTRYGPRPFINQRQVNSARVRLMSLVSAGLLTRGSDDSFQIGSSQRYVMSRIQHGLLAKEDILGHYTSVFRPYSRISVDG